MSSPIRQFTRAAAALGALHMIGMALTFAMGVLLARQLGPSGYGIYAIAMTIATFAGLLTEFGLPTLVMREFAKADASKKWGQLKGLIQFSQSIYLIFGAFLTIIFALLFLGGYLKSELSLTLIFASALVPIVAFSKTRGVALLALGRTTAGQLPNLIVRPGLFTVALGIAWYLGCELRPAYAMLWHVIACLFAAILIAIMFRQHVPIDFWAQSPEFLHRRWLKSSIPMGATEGLRLVQGQAAIVMLGLFSSPENAGLYKVADATMMICLVPSSLLNLLAGSYFARLHAEKRHSQMQSLLSAVCIVIVLSLTLSAVAISLWGPELITFAFGEEFASAAPALLVLAIGWLLLSLLGPVASLANMIGLEKLVAIGMGIAILAQLILATVLIPAHGVVGAAFSVILSQLMLLSFVSYHVARDTVYRPSVLAIPNPRRIIQHLRKIRAHQVSSNDEMGSGSTKRKPPA